MYKKIQLSYHFLSEYKSPVKNALSRFKCIQRLTVLNHIIRMKPFYRFSRYLSRTRSRSYFICFAYPPPFSPRFRGNLLYARYIVFRPLASAYRGIPTPDCLFRRLTLAVFLWNSTVSDTHTRTRVYRVYVYDDVLVSIAEAAPNVLFCTYFPLIHPSRPLTPLTTVYQAG